jgi:hypothetical protein
MRSLGDVLVLLFQIIFNRKITEEELQSLLSTQGIDTRWIDELREARKLFFHETAPWLAIRVEQEISRVDPVLLKRQTFTFEDPNDLVEFETIRGIYEGFVNSLSELHRYVREQIRLAEENSSGQHLKEISSLYSGTRRIEDRTSGTTMTAGRSRERTAGRLSLMPSGDAQRTWFPEMIVRLRRNGTRECRFPPSSAYGTN